MDLGSGVFPTRNKTYYVVAIAGYSRTHLVKNYEIQPDPKPSSKKK
jgi:hypothetical protein